MKIAVGSISPLKISAVREAFASRNADIMIVRVDAPSGVNAQPIGKDETYHGARNRAHAARAEHPDADLAIGIENGIFLEDGRWLDAAIIVFIDATGEEIVTRGQSVEFPAYCVEEARECGFEITTAGSVLAAYEGCNPADPHVFLTNGRTDRKTLLIETLKGALS